MPCQSCGRLDYSQCLENDSDIRQTLKPLILVLKLCGVYFDAEESQCIRCKGRAKEGFNTHKTGHVWEFFLCPPNTNSEGKKNYCRGCLFVLSLCYNLLVLVVLVCNIVRMLYSMVYDRDFVFSTTYGFLLWDFYIVACVLCMWNSSGNKRYLR